MYCRASATLATRSAARTMVIALSEAGSQASIPHGARVAAPAALADGVAARLQARAARAVVLGAPGRALLRRDAAGGLGRVERGLVRGPAVALVLVPSQLLLALAVPRIDVQLVAPGRGRFGRCGRGGIGGTGG